MAKTDEHFKVLMSLLKDNPKGLIAISEIMQSHMAYSIDPRLSSDPLTALAAVMQHHKIAIENVDGCQLRIHVNGLTTDYVADFLDSDDIKPELDIEN